MSRIDEGDAARCQLESGRARIVFGGGRFAELGAEVSALGLGRLLAIGTPRHRLDGEVPVVARVEQVRSHVPIELVRATRARAVRSAADGVLAVGGGSAIGLAKAVALELGLPVVAVPTTYAGSEMTPIWGVTEAGVKTTGVNLAVLPRLVVYDPALGLTLPTDVSAASGLNALAHAVEALWAPSANPVATAVAVEAIAVLPGALRRIVREGADLEARTAALRGAWLAGTALAQAGTAVHHALCHLLGGRFDLDHAGVHAVLLPHVCAHVLPDAGGARTRLAAALGDDEPALALHRLVAELGLADSLAALGLGEDELREAIELAAAKQLAAPRALGRGTLAALLGAAHRGDAPTTARPARA